MAFCTKCGASVPDNSAFCSACGASQAKAGANTYVATPDGFDPADIAKNKVVCALSYLGILFFLPLVICPESKFGRFHANQGLILLITNVGLSIAATIVNIILGLLFTALLPLKIIGTLLTTLIAVAVGVASLGLFLYGLINTLEGKANRLPVIGKFTLIS